jgi:hypothetical protein
MLFLPLLILIPYSKLVLVRIKYFFLIEDYTWEQGLVTGWKYTVSLSSGFLRNSGKTIIGEKLF